MKTSKEKVNEYFGAENVHFKSMIRLLDEYAKEVAIGFAEWGKVQLEKLLQWILGRN